MDQINNPKIVSTLALKSRTDKTDTVLLAFADDGSVYRANTNDKPLKWAIEENIFKTSTFAALHGKDQAQFVEHTNPPSMDL